MKNDEKNDGPSELVLGGHSFITKLGNDPAIAFEEQLEIVNECLEAGINCFDTTYEPERIGLGRVLEELGRRAEAHIIAWNFFADEETGEYLGQADPYEAGHIERMLSDLRTDFIDMLVVHPAPDKARNHEQIEVAKTWAEAGQVGKLGIWGPEDYLAQHAGAETPYDFAVMVRNVRHQSTDIFGEAKARGWQTLATSPFGRGWLLDELVELEMEQASEEEETVRGRIADALLRFSWDDPNVDHVIVGIRKKEWIGRNLESIRKGPLSEGEREWLMESFERTEARRACE